jgi:Asp-tRNA(Asn)/Glu-tRNA(Gln) amidotransferase B subunit
LAELLRLIAKGSVSGKMAKDILAEMFSTGKTAGALVSEKGLAQITDEGRIATVAREVIAANPKQVEQYRGGKTATLGWLVGQVMKATRGQASPQVVQEVLKKELGRQDDTRNWKLGIRELCIEFPTSIFRSGNGLRTTDNPKGVNHAQYR